MVRIDYFKDVLSKDFETVWAENIGAFLIEQEFTRDELLDLRFFKSDVIGVELDTADTSFLEINDGIICVIHGDQVPKGPAIPYLIVAVVTAVVSYAISKYMLSKIDTDTDSISTDSTTSLASPTNSASPNERIDDNFGTLTYYVPRLWQQPYRIGVNDREVVVLLCCLGRGKYEFDLDNVRDTTTRMNNIASARADFYEPGSHPGKGTPHKQIGTGIDEPIGKYYELNDLVATELLPPNDLSLGDDADWYASRDYTTNIGTLRLDNYDDLDVDLTEYFAVGSDILLIDCVVIPSFFSNKTIYREVSGEVTSQVMSYISYPISKLDGSYEILSVTEDTITLDVTGSWGVVTSSESLIENQWYEVTFNPFENGYVPDLGDLDDHTWYSNESLTTAITYDTVDWNPDVGQVFDNVVGPFTLPDSMDKAILNFTSSSGYFNVKGSSYKSLEAEIQITVQELDEDYEPTGTITRTVFDYDSNNSVSTAVYRTAKVDIPYQYAAIYARRLTKRVLSDSVTNYDKIEWSNLFGFEDVDAENISFGDVSLAHVYIVNNNQSRLIKELQFNLDFTRKITQYLGDGEFGETEEYATDDACQIAIHTALDKHIGRVTINDIAADDLLALSEEVTEYFGSSEMVRFGYAFDDTNIAYADIFAQLMDTINAIPYVDNGVYSAYFERPRTSSQTQVTCRNKVANTEERSDVFYNKYDSVELTYRDEEYGVSTVIYIPDDQSGVSPYRITMNGIVTELQAYRRALREYNKIIYVTQTVEFQTDDFGQLILPGMRIDSPDGTRFTSRDDTEYGYKIFSGEIVELNGLVVELSDPVEFTDGEDHYIQFTNDDGTNSDLIQCTEYDEDGYYVLLSSLPTDSLYDGYERDKTKFTFCSEQVRDSTAVLVRGNATKYSNGVELHTISGVNYTENYYKGDFEIVEDTTAPIFTSLSTATSITENTGAGQLVYTVNTEDESPVTYSIDNTDDFTIDESTGEVYLIANPDYETTDSYSFTVTATDSHGNSAVKSVSLNILNDESDDADTTAPVFTSSTTATAIVENSGSGQLVYTAVTTDDNTVTYSIDNTDDFTIDSSTGAVYLTANPDYETTDSYSFTVTATDDSSNSSSITVSLSITNDTSDDAVIDNDAPVFTSSTSANAITENTGPGQLVYTATATDVGTVTYSIDNSDFTINSSTGQVYLTDDPDYEVQSSYSFTVTATDNSGNSLDIVVSLTIVNDESDDTVVDDDSPVFTSSTTATAIVENSGAGQAVYTATTTDVSTVTYSIDNTDFTIDSSTGVVYLTDDPDYETLTSYTFTVTATDSNSNSSSITVSLSITNDTSDDASTGTTLYAPTTTLDFNTVAALKTKFNSVYSQSTDATPLWDNNATDYFSFTQNEILFTYDNFYHLDNNIDSVDKMVTTIEHVFDNNDVRRVEKGTLTLLPFWDSTNSQYNTDDGTVSGTKLAGVYHSAPSNHVWDGTPGKGFSSFNATGGVINPRLQILTCGQIIGAVAKCCNTILSDSSLSAYHTKAIEFLGKCKDVLDDYTSTYTTQTFTDYSSTYGNVDVSAYYYPSETGQSGSVYSTVLAFNHSMGAHLAAMVLHKHGISSAYLPRAQAWFDFIRLSLCRTEYTNSDGTVRFDWPYTIDNTHADVVSEDINHLSFYVGSVYETAWEEGLCGVDTTEMTKIANSLWNARKSDGGIAQRIDGSGTLGDDYTSYLGHMGYLSTLNSNLAQWITDKVNDDYDTATTPVMFRAFSHMLKARDIGITPSS